MSKRSHRKPSKRKMMRASNGCCPVIRVKCYITKGRKKTTYVPDSASDYTEMVGGGRKLCSVSLGNRIISKRLTTDKTGKKVNELRQNLLAKRCQAIVQSEK